MLRIFLKLISVVFLISCSDNEEVQNTEIITDSYFFQKKVFNMNLYNCTTPIENVDSTYKKTSDSLSLDWYIKSRKQQFSMGKYMAIRRISRRISLRMDKL